MAVTFNHIYFVLKRCKSMKMGILTHPYIHSELRFLKMELSILLVSSTSTKFILLSVSSSLINRSERHWNCWTAPVYWYFCWTELACHVCTNSNNLVYSKYLSTVHFPVWLKRNTKHLATYFTFHSISFCFKRWRLQFQWGFKEFIGYRFTTI